MTKKTDTSPQETFDHGQARLLPSPIKPSQLFQRILVWLQAGTWHPDDPSVMIWGPPGCGKTSIVEQLVAKLGYLLFEWRLGSMTIVDMIGLPVVDRERGITNWARPSLVPPSDAATPSVVFVDELTQATPAITSQAYQVFRERRVGPHVLPRNCFTLAAGNRQSDKGVFYAMPKPLVNRFRHYELVPDLDDFLAWNMAQQHLVPEVHAYLRANPHHVFMMNVDSSPLPFPTPRSWTYACRTIQRYAALYPSNRVQALEAARVDLEGEIGPSAASQFYAYVKHFSELPDVEALMRGQIDPPVPSPDKPDVLWALLSSMVAHALRVQDLTPFVRYANKFPANYAVLMVLDAARQGEEVKRRLTASGAWATFATAHQQAIAAYFASVNQSQ